MRNTLFVLALGLAACARPQLGHRLHVGGMHVEPERVWALVAAEARSDFADDALFVVVCPRSTEELDSAACSWRRLEVPHPAADRTRAMIRMASATHGCPAERIEVISGAGDEYWLNVCGRRRLMRWDPQLGRFVDRTP